MGGTAISKGMGGAIGTVPEVIAISPLENVKLAAQLDKEGKFKGSADITRHIIKTRGFGGLMTGYAGMQVRQMLWTDVCRSVVQKKALAATFDPNSVRPSAMEPLNPGPFFSEASAIFSSRGIGGLYAGVGPKMVHLGGSGAILAVLMPRFKTMYFDFMGVY